ncbi:MAG: hypothetical protein MUC65_02825 [Pontiellaceae bacterium]|jgi:uncharacterized protein (TIGR02001 family)|nr:hypothetical protein [Pontiellaceae bacterium]
MKKKTIMITAAALAAGIVSAADVSVTADFASAYIFRGVTFNDGLVFQPGAKISGLPIPEEFGSIALGTWANFDINDNGLGKEFTEVDYYVAYTLPVTNADLGVTYTEYTYPQGGAADREVAFSAGKAIGETGLYPSIALNYGLEGVPEKDCYIQGGLDFSMSLTEELSFSTGIKVAYLINDSGTDGFSDAVAKAGLGYTLTENWSLSASLNYVAQLDDDILPDADANAGTLGYDKEIFATLGLACSF